MKKQYIHPSVESTHEIDAQPLCLSDVTGNNGIGYGGTDEEGEKDPDAKEREGEEEFMIMLIEQERVDKKSLW